MKSRKPYPNPNIHDNTVHYHVETLRQQQQQPTKNELKDYYFSISSNTFDPIKVNIARGNRGGKNCEGGRKSEEKRHCEKKIILLHKFTKSNQKEENIQYKVSVEPTQFFTPIGSSLNPIPKHQFQSNK